MSWLQYLQNFVPSSQAAALAFVGLAIMFDGYVGVMNSADLISRVSHLEEFRGATNEKLSNIDKNIAALLEEYRENTAISRELYAKTLVLEDRASRKQPNAKD